MNQVNIGVDTSNTNELSIIPLYVSNTSDFIKPCKHLNFDFI